MSGLAPGNQLTSVQENLQLSDFQLTSPAAFNHIQLQPTDSSVADSQKQSYQCHSTSPHAVHHPIPAFPSFRRREPALPFDQQHCPCQSYLHAGTWLVCLSDLNSGSPGWSCGKPGSSDGLAVCSARNLVHVSPFWLIPRPWRAPSRPDVTSPTISAVLAGGIAVAGQQTFL